MRGIRAVGVIVMLFAIIGAAHMWWTAPAPFDPLDWCRTSVRLDPAMNLTLKDPQNHGGTICLLAQRLEVERGGLPGMIPQEPAITEAKAIWRRSR
ncbi:hypothetical protein ACQW02_02130 [Humitalea sp. 24SJ18S-53]|uniref:hypothetical protein n=1 Tax=Humitalea sp. 24SJ18S-53 TaxID=3422307 RepID=UPI003D67F67F